MLAVYHNIDRARYVNEMAYFQSNFVQRCGCRSGGGGLAILFDEEAEGVDDASEKRAQ